MADSRFTARVILSQSVGRPSPPHHRQPHPDLHHHHHDHRARSSRWGRSWLSVVVFLFVFHHVRIRDERAHVHVCVCMFEYFCMNDSPCFRWSSSALLSYLSSSTDFLHEKGYKPARRCVEWWCLCMRKVVSGFLVVFFCLSDSYRSLFDHLRGGEKSIR